MASKEEIKPKVKMPDRMKGMFLLKSALEFNANIIILATQVVATNGGVSNEGLEQLLKENFENYKTTIENIMKS